MAASSHRTVATRARLWRGLLTAALLTLAASAPARADDPVKGDVRVETANGFTRLVFRFEQTVPSQVRLSWPVMVIEFKKPVAVPVDGLRLGAPNLITAARLDPDGNAIRIALSAKIKVNTIAAAERYYVDLLPENWSGVLPGLPQEVVEELAERTREAERQLKSQRLAERERKVPAIRVRVATQPTFTRYVFDLPDTVNVVPARSTDRLTLSFDQQVRWDLSDALGSLPQTLSAIEAKNEGDGCAVMFVLSGTPEVRTFREDHSIVVDVGHDGAKLGILQPAEPKAAPPKQDGPALAAVPDIAPPATVPAPAAAAPQPKAAPPEPAPKLPPAPPAPPPAPKADAAPKTEPVAKGPAMPPPPPAPKPDGTITVRAQRSAESLRLEFPFVQATPAAVFTRADTLWMVFDSPAKIDVSALSGHASDGVRDVTVTRGAEGEAIVRLKMSRPRLASVDTDGPVWIVTIADIAAAPAHPLAVARSIVGKNRANIVIPFEQPGRLFHIADPEIGDRLMVVTAPGPARGFVRAQDYVELHALASSHGIAVHPIADDVTADLTDKKVSFSRPGGLSLSTAIVAEEEPGVNPNSVSLDRAIWSADQKSDFLVRQSELARQAAMAPPAERRGARFELARFYLAKGMSAEAKAVLDVAAVDEMGPDDVTGSVLTAVADVMLARPDEALKELAKPQIGDRLNAQVWRAVALARARKWADARTAFKNMDSAIAALPVELQRIAMLAELRTAIETGDYTQAARLASDLGTVGVGTEEEGAFAVLNGRLNQGLGRVNDALVYYRAASGSPDRRAAAQGRLYGTSLRLARNEITRNDAIVALETLTSIWRGDDIELEGLKLLAHLYTEDGRWRDAFHVMRTALMAHPNAAMTNTIQDEAAVSFDGLYLSPKGETLTPIEALALFYDYRELTPIGRRGDEMIRRLADRLVSVDLLDQAAELLQHQIDHRLNGAARAQVATRLATIYLMNHKPDSALTVLQKTRSSELAAELREQRLLLEARALSAIGRHELALEMVANIHGPQVARLHADILWAAKKWREAAEQIELVLGDRWRQVPALNEAERFDALRAATGYALADETLALARFRERYGPMMSKGPEAHAFDVVSAPIGTGSVEFQEITRRIGGIDTLEAFLRDMHQRYPNPPASDPSAAKAPPPPPAKAPPDKAAAAPVKPDAKPTGSIARAR